MPDIADQYRIIAEGAGWRRRSDRGRLRFSGADRSEFLQALLTNDISTLGAGQGAYAAYLTPQGRMIADLHLFAREDHFIADVPASDARTLAETFDRLVFTEDVSVSDVSASLAQLSVIGGAAADVLSRALGADASGLRNLPVWSHSDLAPGFVARTDDATLPSYDIVVPMEQESAVIESLAAAGTTELAEELWAAIRIDAGRPAFGVDMDNDTIPLEAGLLDRAISTTKGCYVGQEIVIRVLHRGGGRVARRLVKVAFHPGASHPPERGATLRIADREAGRVTSVAPSLDGSGTLALAYVRRELAEIGQALEIDGIPPVRGVITSFAG